MKKNKFSVFGMLAIVLALGFVFAGCATGQNGNGGGDVPKAIKIIGNFAPGFTDEALYLFPSSTRPDSWPPVAIGWGVNSEGNLRLVKWYPGMNSSNIEDWTETGK